MKQYHIQLDRGEVGDYVLMPGDPGRCERIAQHFDSPVYVGSNREFTTWNGTLAGVRVTAMSTGIGGPSTAIAAEELAAIGVRTMIRVGTCGAMDESLRMGDVVIAHGAIRNEGTSHQYVPAEFPAVADLDVLRALEQGAATEGIPSMTGIVQCCDALYSEISPDTVPAGPWIKERWQAWKQAGCIAAEMESSTLFVLGSIRKFRAGGVFAVVNTAQGGDDSLPDPAMLPLDRAISTAVAALRVLIARDAAPAASAASSAEPSLA